MPPSICIFGDLMLDTVTHLEHLHPDNFDDLSLSNAIELQPGGTGVVAALAAIQQGFSQVTLIGSIGAYPDGKPDTAAQLILDTLNKTGIQLLLRKETNVATGTTMITYFKDDRRMLVADKGANGSLTSEHITPALLTTVATSDILYISGYSLLVAEQAQAIVRLSAEAQKHRRVVVLDVVPHRIYEAVPGSLFQTYTCHVSVLVSNTRTIRKLFPAAFSPETDAGGEWMADYLLQHYHAVILRPDIDHQVLYNKKGFKDEIATRYSQVAPAQSRGYLDRFTIKSLYDFYERLIG